MNIKEISYGWAFQVTDEKGHKHIEVNKHLKEDPILYNSIMDHELEHYHSPNQWLDFWIDFKSLFSSKHSFRKMAFAWKHPSVYLCYSPILIDKIDGKYVIGFNLFALILLISIILIETFIYLYIF